MKARQAKREKLVAKYAAKLVIMRLCRLCPTTPRPCVCTTVASSLADPRAICVSLASRASTSVSWHRPVSSQA